MQTTRGTPLTGGSQVAQAPPDNQARRPWHRAVAWLAVAAALTYAADLLSKVLVVARLEGRPPVTLIPGVLDLQVTRNGGAAFSLGTGATWLFTAVAVVVVAAIVRTARRLRSRAWAVDLGLLLGGAVGNLTDRLFRAPGPWQGHVVDWIHLHHWPVFNVADAAITVGALLAVVLSLRGVGVDGRREGGHRGEG